MLPLKEVGVAPKIREKVSSSPEYVKESLQAVRAHRFGAVLSWNIMEAPDSHIACLGQ